MQGKHHRGFTWDVKTNFTIGFTVGSPRYPQISQKAKKSTRDLLVYSRSQGHHEVGHGQLKKNHLRWLRSPARRNMVDHPFNTGHDWVTHLVQSFRLNKWAKAVVLKMDEIMRTKVQTANDDVKDSFDDAGLQWWLLHLWCILEEEEIRKLRQEAQREKST